MLTFYAKDDSIAIIIKIHVYIFGTIDYIWRPSWIYANEAIVKFHFKVIQILLCMCIEMHQYAALFSFLMHRFLQLLYQFNMLVAILAAILYFIAQYFVEAKF